MPKETGSLGQEAAERRIAIAHNALGYLTDNDRENSRRNIPFGQRVNLSNIDDLTRTSIEQELIAVAESMETYKRVAQQERQRHTDLFDPAAAIWMGVVTEEKDGKFVVTADYYCKDLDGNIIRLEGSGMSRSRSRKEPATDPEKRRKEEQYDSFRTGTLTRGMQEMGKKLDINVWGDK